MRQLAVLVAGVIALGVWAAAGMVGLTGMTYFEPQAGTVPISDRGTARVTECTRVGPVSSLGIGYRWQCRATVEWDSGRTEDVTAQASQLTPDDQGRDAPVVERKVLGNKNGPPTSRVYRADFEPSAVLGLGSMLAGIGVGGLLAIIIFGSTLSRNKQRR